ncbi:MotA/TolQ/ExbB proton channel family protein [Psychrobacter arenosus]|uniref:MotA/TolQ/ExbB proton channel family protein n=1 Tax=Psychrobacter arenosus TaxID=256326 RepID=UPI001919EB08|nr:MotA/TolQ/ExbB proton channel family protein [Psychrobacter arenosus]
MWELVMAGGWLMMPIVACSVIVLVIVIERTVRLRYAKVAPPELRQQLIERLRTDPALSKTLLLSVKDGSPLGDILATGLLYRQYGLESMTMHMQNRASVQIHQLEKNINMLGTIGAIAPLLGLLGTVLGIIASFLAVTDGAMQDPTLLAAGVSQALITTAAGMFVAIPALVAYRYFQRRIVDINAEFETEAGLMLQAVHDYDLLSVAQLNRESQPVKTSKRTQPTNLDTVELLELEEEALPVRSQINAHVSRISKKDNTANM